MVSDSPHLVLPVTQDIYDKVMSGERHEVYLHLSPKWIMHLVDGVDDQQARELSWHENRGRLQCALSIGRLHICFFESVRLVAPMRTAIYDLGEITIQPTPDNREDVFVIRLGDLQRIVRHFG